MIQDMLNFCRNERKYVLLALLLAATYGAITQLETPDESSVAASDALKQFQASEAKLSANLKNSESLETYLRANPETAAVMALIFIFAGVLYVSGIFVDGAILFNGKFRRWLTAPESFEDGTQWKLSMLFKAILLFIAFSIGIQLFLSVIQLMVNWLPENLLLLLQTTLVDLFCVYILADLARQNGGTWRDLGLRVPSRRPLREVMTGIVGYMGVFPIFITFLIALVVIAHVLSYEPPAHPLVNIILEEEDRFPFLIIYSVILATVIAPILEEIFFRGFCYPILKKRWGARVAMVLTSAFFAAIHANLFAFVPIFILGMGLSFIYEKRRSLIAPIALHLVHNSIFIGYFFAAKKIITAGL